MKIIPEDKKHFANFPFAWTRIPTDTTFKNLRNFGKNEAYYSHQLVRKNAFSSHGMLGSQNPVWRAACRSGCLVSGSICTQQPCWLPRVGRATMTEELNIPSCSVLKRARRGKKARRGVEGRESATNTASPRI